MKTIRWGIIGCGNVTEVKSGPGFQKARGSELIAVMRRDGAKAADYAKRHGVARWYDDADALIADKDVDAVYVATPPGTHEFYAMKVLAAGKSCYVEKPMARNASEARRMVEGFRARGVPLFVAYYRRALPRFLNIKELLDPEGDLMLGDLVSATYRHWNGAMVNRDSGTPWRLNPEHSGGGLFLDLGSHVLDLLDYWLGPLKVMRSRVENSAGAFAVEDRVALECEGSLPNLTSVEFSFSAGEDQDEFTMVFEKATITLSCFGNEPLRVKTPQGQPHTIALPNPEHVAQPLIQAVVDDLLGLRKCPSTGESGLRTQEVMDEVLTGYYGGREDGFWRRDWPGNRQGTRGT